MSKNTYYLMNMIKYWKKLFHMIRHHSEWHLSEITVDELLEHINFNQPPSIFDIRSVQEFNGPDGHIPNAMSIPIRKLSSNLKNPQSYIYGYKHKEIVTICPGGGLSLIAVDILVESGFANVKSLNGGLDLWRQKGFPLITTAEDSIISHEDTNHGTFEGIEAKQPFDEKFISIAFTLDARGLVCPEPILKSKKKLKTLKIGQALEILTTDPGSKRDIPAWTHVTGQELLVAEETGSKEFRFLVKRMK
jgi:tRNA 2-thiouridine synthesizing protein A